MMNRISSLVLLLTLVDLLIELTIGTACTATCLGLLFLFGLQLYPYLYASNRYLLFYSKYLYLLPFTVLKHLVRPS